MTQEPVIRLFVAIELPDGVRYALSQVQAYMQERTALQKLRWVKPEGIHLTLKFLGEVALAQQAEIEEALDEAVAEIPSFELALGKLGKFGGRQSPRVLWTDVNGDEEALEALSSLHGQIESAMAKLGFPPDGRAFAPHLTLARVPQEKGGEVARPLTQAIDECEPPEGVIPVNDIVLMKSDLGPGGAKYTPLHRVPLGEAQGYPV
jgi:2'-5' RNA ligase